ncbi:MAG: MarR family transcriptional regulator [Ruminococcaceae bacterium]|nr:MarR family transcriptional regulator [Oscillospiraceae bacterium]
MKCPYCSRDLALGYLYNGTQPVQWLPDGKKPSYLNFSVSENAVELQNSFSFFKVGGYAAEAYYCDTCHIVLAKTK